MGDRKFLINHTVPSLFRIGGKRFQPGVQTITEDEWNSIKDHPSLPKKFELGHLVWIPGKGPDDKKGHSKEVVETKAEAKEKDIILNPLTDVNANEAKKLIKSVYDTELLKEWLQQEKRVVVLKAIQDQIDAILAPPQEETKES